MDGAHRPAQRHLRRLTGRDHGGLGHRRGLRHRRQLCGRRPRRQDGPLPGTGGAVRRLRPGRRVARSACVGPGAAGRRRAGGADLAPRAGSRASRRARRRGRADRHLHGRHPLQPALRAGTGPPRRGRRRRPARPRSGGLPGRRSRGLRPRRRHSPRPARRGRRGRPRGRHLRHHRRGLPSADHGRHLCGGPARRAGPSRRSTRARRRTHRPRHHRRLSGNARRPPRRADHERWDHHCRRWRVRHRGPPRNTTPSRHPQTRARTCDKLVAGPKEPGRRTVQSEPEPAQPRPRPRPRRHVRHRIGDQSLVVGQERVRELLHHRDHLGMLLGVPAFEQLGQATASRLRRASRAQRRPRGSGADRLPPPRGRSSIIPADIRPSTAGSIRAGSTFNRSERSATVVAGFSASR